MTQASHEAVDLVTGELPPFTGLGTLSDLDLQFLGGTQVSGCDTKTSRSNLLDLGVFDGAEAGGIFAPLTGVAHSAEAVHRFGHRFMGFGGDRSETHRSGGEALQYLLGRFDLLECNRLTLVCKGKEVTDKLHPAPFEHRFELAKIFRLSGLGELVDRMDGFRGEVVVFTPLCVFVDSSDVKGEDVVFHPGIVGIGMGFGDAGTDLFVPQSFEEGVGAVETFGNHFVTQTDDIVEFGVAVAGDGRNPHFGHDLKQTGIHRFAQALEADGVVDILFTPAGHIDGCRIVEIRVDRCRTVGEECRRLVGVVYFPGGSHDAGGVTQFGFKQCFVDPSNRHEHGDRTEVLVDPAIVKEDDAHSAIPDIGQYLLDESVQGFFEPLFIRHIVPFGVVGRIVFGVVGIAKLLQDVEFVK